MKVHMLMTDFGGGDHRICGVFADRAKANRRLVENLQELTEKEETTIVGFLVETWLVNQ